MGSLEQTDAAAAAVQKTPNRITLDHIKARIAQTMYVYPSIIPHLTICVVVLENGYAVVGKSAPADPVNFDKALGEQFAYEDAIRQIWPLEAYLLRDEMYLDSLIDSDWD